MFQGALFYLPRRRKKIEIFGSFQLTTKQFFTLIQFFINRSDQCIQATFSNWESDSQFVRYVFNKQNSGELVTLHEQK